MTETKEIKSIRLNKAIRDSILESVLDGAVKSPHTIDDVQSVVDKMWEDEFGKIDFSVIPAGFLTLGSYLNVNIQGQARRLNMSKDRPLPDDYAHITYIKNTKTVEKYLRMNNDLTDHQKHRREMSREVNQVLSSVNTTKQLLEVWPDVEDYIPAHILDPNQAVMLPALTISRLNERLQINKKK